MTAALSSHLARASGWAMGALLVALALLDLSQVVLRYALGLGWPWAGDLSIIGLLTLAWLGAGHLWLRGAHIAVRLLPERLFRVIDAFWALVALVLIALAVPMAWGAVVLYGAIDLAALPLPMAAKFVPVLGGLLWLGAAVVLRALAR